MDAHFKVLDWQTPPIVLSDLTIRMLDKEAVGEA